MIARNEPVKCGRSTEAVTLEGNLRLPGENGCFPGAVLCHPHPAGGGDMHVPLLDRLSRVLCGEGRAVLSFNFAGVGASGGIFTDGADEPLDVAAAFEHLRSLPEIDSGSIDVVGWSFGSWMALQALARGLLPRRVVAISPPLDAYDCAGVAGTLSDSPVERHYLAGDRDRLCPVETLEAFAGAISPQDADRVEILAGADHFFAGRESEVAEIVSLLLS